MDYEIQPAEVQGLRDSGAQFTFIDCREPWEFQAAHIEGSQPMPMQDIPERIQELDPDDHIVVICHRGVRSLNVTAWLRQQGYEKTQSVAGGIDRWSRTVDPTIPIY
jgi:rhodanese-related sulfurtransferase